MVAGPPFFFRLYGLNAEFNHPIPGVKIAPLSEVDLRVGLQACPIGTGSTADRLSWYGNKPGLTGKLIDQGKWVNFEFRDDSQFFVERQGREVWGAWPESFPLSYILPYLLGPIMGFTLRMRGVTCLHASAISIDRQAVAIVGAPGAGKSTTAAAFAVLGFPVFTDDIVPLYPRQGAWYVEPGYPRVCLWPPSVRALFGSDDALPLITEDWEKCYVDLHSPPYRFQEQAQPLSAIYLLERTDGPFSVRFCDLQPRESVLELIANTFGGGLPMPQMSGSDLQVYSQILKQVPVRRVAFCGDPTRIRDLAGAIAEDFARRAPMLASRD